MDTTKNKMDNAEFKKIVRKKLTEAGFVYRNKNYYCGTENLIVVIDLQKSNFSDGWYIDFGFYVKAVHDVINEYPKLDDCDMDGRFHNYISPEAGPLELTMPPEDIEAVIQNDLEKKIFPVLENGIEEYFRLYPTAKNGAVRRLKDYLGIEY